MTQHYELNLKNLSDEEVKKLKEKLAEVYGTDVNTYKEMNLYTDSFASVVINGKIDNGIEGNTFDEWVDNFVKELQETEDTYVAFYDKLEYDGIDHPNKRELHIYIGL